MNLMKGVIPLLCLLLILISAGIFQVSGEEAYGGLIQVTSEDELQSYLANVSSPMRYGAGYAFDMAESAMPMVAKEMAPVPTASAPVTGAAGTDYSTTNIQVAGVDEADFIKNDGKYIYIRSRDGLSIVDVYPPEQGRIVTEIPVSGKVSELFLSGNRLVVFSSGRSETWYTPEGTNVPVPEYQDRTHAIIYDISDRSAPKRVRDISAPGTYENARMIGDFVYLLSAESPDYYNPRMPVVYDGNQAVTRPLVWCPPSPMNEYRMNTLTAFSVHGSGSPDAESFLLGYDNTLYVSTENIFIAYEKQRSWWGLPLLLEETESFESDKAEQESVIHRFSIKDGSIDYKATGTVPGYLLNQFSLDEYRGNLRVATTVSDWSLEEKQYSNVYIFDPDLKIIGRLEHLAPEEKIYSARFMQDILYMVTFKQTDPLFVIDLSNPYQPGILGELKIPGYSDYLHPYDETHLIGIGKDTEENEWGGIIPTGVKIALFDVSDLTNPRLIDSIILGEKGSESAILSDHRAFLLDKERDIMVIPIREVRKNPVTGSKYEGSYTEDVWQGAYVFGINPEKGFIEKGTIQQGDEGDKKIWWYGSKVLRSLFIDDVLYTVSRDMIVASDLKDLTRRLMEISVPASESYSWY